MAARNGNARAQQVQTFMKEQIEEAQKRIHVIEGEAKKALGTLVEKGKQSRKELQLALRRFNAKDMKFLENPSATVNATVKQIGRRAEAAGTEMRKRFDALQSRIIEVSGVASQTQLKALNKELHRLTKKVDGLMDRKAKSEAHA